MSQIDLNSIGITNPQAIHHNLTPAALVEHALRRQEGLLSETGAFSVKTGKYTGRSPDDRFIVDEPEVRDLIDWGKVNKPVPTETFDRIHRKICDYLEEKEVYVFDGFAGADPAYRQRIRVVNERASQNLFIRQLLLRPESEEQNGFEPDFTIIAAPGVKCDPAADGVNSEAAIIVSFARRMVIIAGSAYAGEIKKSVFSVMNFLLPQKGVLSMHCSANVGEAGDSALFFGLSGTGKTTLSADPKRRLIGDDEHGWSDSSIFNIEGGCYAKCINLSREHEPDIYNAIRFGALVENVVMDPDTRVFDYDDGSLTENTRAGYPVEFIANAQIPGIAGHPDTIIFLTADAFGVLPPVSRLTADGAMYHYLSGYTAKLSGTERGIDEPTATFSACFGAPFLPLPPAEYAKLLGEKIRRHKVRAYLVNTGWSGGPYGVGSRIKLPLTRAMVSACLDGNLEKVSTRRDPIFNLDVPTACPGVPDHLLDPRATWADQAAYDAAAHKLAGLFQSNIKKFSNVAEEVLAAGPQG
ncbi:MAG: phosphoenolpyruvate carboxykinase (ATP) [Eubacteriales bacterium]|nr:phosphoenolpyruvate carboxykinase (ATP) [Eubacteriales bacterium]